MTSRERFALTMRHKSPGRPPIDMGSISLTNMRPGLQKQLKHILGFGDDYMPSNAGVDERILQWAQVDFRGVGNMVEMPSVHTRVISPAANVNCWGVEYGFIDNEWQITRFPLQNATCKDLESYPWPEPRIDDSVLEKWQDQAKTLHREGRYVVVAEHPVFGILEIACWLVGYEQIMLSLAGDRDFCRVLFDRILEIQLAIGEQYYKALGPYIDLTISGDDFGTQNGPFISARMFAELITPYFRERIRRIKDVAGCLFWHHSCGSVFRLIPELIRCGVDILNPVQTSAFEMEPQRLKDAYGDRIVFWGGVDVQKLLPDASPDEVRSHVNELIRVLGRDGGYVVAPAHVMQDGIPAENVMAWVETVRDARME